MDLAESLIDSLATSERPAWGYGLRYKFGNMRQFKKKKPVTYQPLDPSASFLAQKNASK